MTRHLLVIGAQRCGTTYLRHLLEAHPQIAMARPARPEPKVFLDPELSSRGREWYVETWFSHAGDADLLGDKSTSYLEHPEAARRARAMLGDPLVHVQLRDPVRRAASNWAFSSDHGLETRPLEEALQACLDGAGPGVEDRAATSVSPFDYLARGRYADQLRPWLAEYGSDLSVGFLEDLIADPRAIGQTYRTLGVDDAFLPADIGQLNASETTPELSEDLAGRLRAWFAESDATLADLLGRRLPWSSVPESGER